MKEIYKEKDKKSILMQLSSGDYIISPFIDGLGFCHKQVGGCWGYIDKDVLIEMVNERLISPNGAILRNGFRILGE